jgi:hypothetical protein
VSSAVALLVAAAVLDGRDVSTLTFSVLVVEFALILVIARAAIETIVDKNGPYFRASSASSVRSLLCSSRISSRTAWTSRA